MAVIEGAVSAALAEVDLTPKALRSALYDSLGNPLGMAENSLPSSIYGIVSMGSNDGRIISSRLDRFGSMAIASNFPILNESWEGSVTNPNRWLITATTMTATQSTVAGLTFNSGLSTAINTGYMIKSTRLIQKTQRAPMQAKFRMRIVPFNNSVMEFGFGDASSINSANTVGVYWQVTSSGVVQPVLTYNSVDQTGSNISTFLNSSSFYTFDILMDDDEVIFYCQNTATGAIISQQTIKLPLTGQRLFSSTAMPVMARIYNTGTSPSAAPQMICSDISVTLLDANFNFSSNSVLSLQNRASYENPFTGVQTSTFANSAAPANATLSNTAAGYATLGGLFSFAAVAGAATDYALFGFQIPAPANFLCTGVDIESWNTGAAVATTPTLMLWSIATQLTAVSLATASHVRIPIGCQSFAVGSAVGSIAQRVTKQFQTPIYCSSSRFFNIILRMPVGTATASQVIQGLINIEGYFV